MSCKKLCEFYEEEMQKAKDSDVLLSLHLKATMMKVTASWFWVASAAWLASFPFALLATSCTNIISTCARSPRTGSLQPATCSARHSSFTRFPTRSCSGIASGCISRTYFLSTPLSLMSSRSTLTTDSVRVLDERKNAVVVVFDAICTFWSYDSKVGGFGDQWAVLEEKIKSNMDGL